MSIEVPLDELWKMLVELSDSIGNQRRSDEQKALEPRLIEAIAYATGGPERASAYLAAPPAQEWEWLELFSIHIVRHARYRPALDAVIQRFRALTDDDDLVHEACQAVIPIIGGSDACEPLAAIIRECPWHIRIYAITAMERIKSADSLRLLVELFAVEQARPDDAEIYDAEIYDDETDDGETGGQILHAICNLCPTGAEFDMLLGLARGGLFDNSGINLKEECSVLSMITGATFPEYADWRREMEPHVRRRAAFALGLSEATEADAKMWQRIVDGLPAIVPLAEGNFPNKPKLLNNDAAHTSDALLPPVVGTVRNQAPKVGRNDPCPCGSGKKYKKCCIDKNEP